MGILDELVEGALDTAIKAGAKALDSVLGDAESTLAKQKRKVGKIRKDLKIKVEKELGGPIDEDNASVIDVDFEEAKQ
jgi:hypothetical protein